MFGGDIIMVVRFENNNNISHSGVKGMKHYQHKFGKWQKQARYAVGRDDPDKAYKIESRTGPMGIMLAGAVQSIAKKNKYRSADKNEKEVIYEILDSPIDEKSGLHLKTNKMSIEEDAEKVNPGFKNADVDTKRNCVNCAIAYDMRRRGYNTMAKKYQYPQFTSGTIGVCYPDVETKEFWGYDPLGHRSSKQLKKDILSEFNRSNNGERGILEVEWPYTEIRHSLIYEKNNGKMTLIDPQSGRTYNDFSKTKILDDLEFAGVSRLDNVEPDYEKVKEHVV